MKGKMEKAVERIDGILEGHFSSLPQTERSQKERAFNTAAKKIDTRAKQSERQERGSSR